MCAGGMRAHFVAFGTVSEGPATNVPTLWFSGWPYVRVMLKLAGSRRGSEILGISEVASPALWSRSATQSRGQRFSEFRAAEPKGAREQTLAEPRTAA
jgi:hypothetical protein